MLEMGHIKHVHFVGIGGVGMAATARSTGAVSARAAVVRSRKPMPVAWFIPVLALLGLLTAHDVVGEKPVSLLREKGGKHDDLTVADLMVPAEVVSVDRMPLLGSGKVDNQQRPLDGANKSRGT